MDSRQTNFLFLYGLIVTLIVISFAMIRRSPKPPVQLDLRAKPQPPVSEPPASIGASAGALNSSSSPGAVPGPSPNQAQIAGDALLDDTAPGRRASVEEKPAEKPATPAAEKSLNVLFNWNGYTWDAYEVLGIPAGSSKDAVRQAFQRAQAQSSSEALPFLQAAADAIEKQLS